MRFWDASALVPLLIDEPERPALERLLREDADMLVWWGTPVECASALARRQRDGSLAESDLAMALERLRALTANWHEVLPTSGVRSTAVRMLRVHPLRASDALQLSAAMAASEQEPESLDFVCLDQRLNAAASREGFSITRTE